MYAPDLTVYFWYSPSTTSPMRLTSRPSVSWASSGSQSPPQMTLITFQPAPRKAAFQLLDDLAVAAHRAVQPLQVAVDDEDQVVQSLAGGQRDRAQRLRLVALAVAEEGPDLRRRGVGLDAAVHQVVVEAGLVDGHDRAQAHGDRGELPEVGHQPGVRIGRQPAAGRQLAAEVLQLLLAQPALEEGPGVDARRGVALEEDLVGRLACPACRGRSG